MTPVLTLGRWDLLVYVLLPDVHSDSRPWLLELLEEDECFGESRSLAYWALQEEPAFAFPKTAQHQAAPRDIVGSSYVL